MDNVRELYSHPHQSAIAATFTKPHHNRSNRRRQDPIRDLIDFGTGNGTCST
jgi:hypothetical protein